MQRACAVFIRLSTGSDVSDHLCNTSLAYTPRFTNPTNPSVHFMMLIYRDSTTQALLGFCAYSVLVMLYFYIYYCRGSTRPSLAVSDDECESPSLEASRNSMRKSYEGASSPPSSVEPTEPHEAA